MTIKQTGGIFGRHPSFGDIETGGLDLSAISGTIGDTAVDIFVYDTRKDSDGGAWRKRTQHTSWYNEAASSTRGSRKEFPAVAVIVAEANQVTIYDGDDPDMPMWMVFNAGTYTYIRNTQIKSVAIKNGIMSVGGSEATYGLSLTDFIGDKNIGSIINTSSGYYVTLPISGRNNTTSSYRVSGIPSGYRLVNDVVNDVAMTVLPNAPIDAATGLPAVTIACATDGGVSVIKDDGTVVDTTSTDVFEGVSFVKSQYGADLYAINTTFADDPRWYPNVGGLSDGFVFTKNFYANTPSYEKLSSDILSRQSGNVFAPIAEHTFAVGMATTVGIGLDPALNLVQHSTTLDDSGLVAFINNDHNTGWQNGAIKLATLSDTDDTNVTGSELVTNGTFDSDISGWTDSSIGTGTIAYSSNTMLLTSNGSSNVGITDQQFANVVVGETYTFTYEITATTGALNGVKLGTAQNTTTYVNDINKGVGVYSHTFTATSTSLWFRLTGYFGVGTTNLDNVSVRLAEEDRSVNNNGLQVFGTVTKSAVSSGADLVAYSGFSASNYLKQPYNSDIPDDEEDLFITAWLNRAASGTVVIADFGEAVSGKRRLLYIPGSTGRLAANNTAAQVSTTSAIPTDTWVQVCLSWSSTGSVILYVNGKVNFGSTLSKTAQTQENPLYIGGGGGIYSTASSEMALVRISSTIASPEQIAKIYNDEKVLFQENAQATLYGSSDAVTALAYDDTTELLHAGTSAGRSVFQGLRRVDNTTTAVGAAISASNGLVADE